MPLTAPDHSINFLEFLQTFHRGELLNQGDAQMQKVIEAMADTAATEMLE